MAAQSHVGSDTQVNRVVLIHKGAAPGANTNIFTALTPSKRACAWRIQIALATESKVDVQVTDGTDAYSQTLNNDTALKASCLYTFTILVSDTSSLAGSVALAYSLRVKIDGVIQTLIIDEIVGGSV